MALLLDEPNQSPQRVRPSRPGGAGTGRNELTRPLDASEFFAPGTGPLQVSEVRGLEAADALAPEWSALVEQTEHTAFSRPELFGAWLRNFAERDAVRVLVARDALGLAAVLPLVEARSSELGGVRALYSAANVHSCRFDFTARAPAAAARAFLEYLSADDSWQVLRLTHVAEGAACWNLLFAAEAAGAPIGTWTGPQSRHLVLPSTMDELRGRLSKNLVSNLRRRRRRLNEAGSVTVEHFRGGPELEQRLDEVFRLEASGWKGREGTAMVMDARTQGFYRDLCRSAAAGGFLSLCFLRLDGQAIAADLALSYRGRFLSMKIAYDESFARFSPGQLLTEDMLEHSISEGLTEYDLLGDDAPYKAEWADQLRPHHWLYIFPRTRTGRALCSAKFKLAPRLKQLLGR